MAAEEAADLVHDRPRRYVEGLPAPARCLVMGVVNVTPDSFSDGGQCYTSEAAIARGRELAAEGADLIDVGGESTRPGAQRPCVAEEKRRVLPVISALAATGTDTGAGTLVSVDTMRADVAADALDAGAVLVNDVSGGLADPKMAALIAERRAAYICMHWRGHSADMQSRARYDDVTGEVCDELSDRLDALVAAGVDLARVAVDPGLGFAKTAEHNWRLLAELERLAELGRPILIGASRKSFLGALLAGDDDLPRPTPGRDHAGTAVATLAAASGVWCVRSHDARATADAVRTVAAWATAPATSRRSATSPPRGWRADAADHAPRW